MSVIFTLSSNPDSSLVVDFLESHVLNSIGFPYESFQEFESMGSILDSQKHLIKMGSILDSQKHLIKIKTKNRR